MTLNPNGHSSDSLNLDENGHPYLQRPSAKEQKNFNGHIGVNAEGQV